MLGRIILETGMHPQFSLTWLVILQIHFTTIFWGAGDRNWHTGLSKFQEFLDSLYFIH